MAEYAIPEILYTQDHAASANLRMAYRDPQRGSSTAAASCRYFLYIVLAPQGCGCAMQVLLARGLGSRSAVDG